MRISLSVISVYDTCMCICSYAHMCVCIYEDRRKMLGNFLSGYLSDAFETGLFTESQGCHFSQSAGQ